MKFKKGLIELQNEVAQNDPNTPISDSARKMTTDLFKTAGINLAIPPNMTYASLAKMDGMLGKVYTARENAISRNEVAKYRADMMAAQNGNRVSNQVDKAVGQQLVSPRSMTPGERQASVDEYMANKAEEVANTYKDNLSPQNFALFQQELAKLASGGKATQSELDSLSPGSFESSLAKIQQKFTNAPVSGNYKDFMNNYMSYVHNMRAKAQGILKARAQRIIDSAPAGLTDEARERYTKAYINRYAPQAPAASPKGMMSFEEWKAQKDANKGGQ